MTHLPRFALLAAALALPGHGWAADGGTNLASAAEAPQKSYFSRLQSEDPNYFVFAHPIDNGELDGDEPHIEFYLSIMYPFNLPENDRWWQPDHILAIYNGLYDFYIIPGERYDSAPILSRRQNPGATLEWDIAEKSAFRFGYFHESNGQTIDGEDGAAAVATEVLQGGEEYALSQVSRGWDYVNARYGHTGGDRWRWTAQVELRQFLHRQGFGSAATEDEIFWDPSNGAKIQDYDGLRLMFEQRTPIPGDVGLRLELKTGTADGEALGNFGGKVSLNWWNCMTLFYFNGYGKEPSSYHLRTEYIGFGLEFR